MVNKNLKRCSMSNLRERQIKSTMSYHLKPVRMARKGRKEGRERGGGREGEEREREEREEGASTCTTSHKSSDIHALHFIQREYLDSNFKVIN